MKKKFGTYRVDFKKIGKPVVREGGLVETKALITGDIEIGIDIDLYSWTGDWLREATFGDEASEYRLVTIVNSYQEDNEKGEEVNKVTACWRKKDTGTFWRG